MSISALYLDSQLASLEKFGFGRAESLGALGIGETDLDDPRFRLPLKDAVRLYEAAALALGRPSLGLEVGADFRVSAFAKSGRIYAFCRDIREVVDINARYQVLSIDAGTISFVEEDGRTFIDLDPHYWDSAGYRHITDLVFGAYGSAFEWLNWGSGQGNKAVFLRHSAPADIAPYEKAFRCPVVFDSPHNRIEFFPETVDTPLPTADPDRLALTRARLDKLLASSDRSVSSIEAATRAAIQTSLRSGATNQAAVADILGMTERQLRSELAQAGLGFRQLMDAVRQELYDHQRLRGRNLAQIAQDLGYNDQAAFTRAFKRWYGHAPSEHGAS